MSALRWSSSLSLACFLLSLSALWPLGSLSAQEIRVPKSIDLGLVPPNNKKFFQLTIANPEKFSQRINIDTSCDCMATERFRDFGPGEETTVAVEFSSNGFPNGNFMRRIELVTEGAKNRVFVDIIGEIGTIMVPEEKEVRFENISRRRFGGGAGKTLVLRGRNDAPIYPMVANITVPFIKAEAVSLTKFYWELRIFIDAESIPTGQLSGSYKLVIRDELNRQFLELPIIWIRQVPIVFDPNPLLILAAPDEEFEVKLNYKIMESRREAIREHERRNVYMQREPAAPVLPARIVSIRIEGFPLKYRLEKDCIMIIGKLPEDAEKGMTGYIFVTLDDRDDPEHAVRFAIIPKRPVGPDSHSQ